MNEKNKERLVNNQKNLIAWRENHDEKALIELMNSNEGFIGYFASKYAKYGIDYDDLFSIGREAFLRSINMFDYKKSPIETFSTYAGNAIRRDIVRELQKEFMHHNNISIYAPISKGKNGDELTLEETLGTDIDELVDSIIAKFKNENIQKFFTVLTPMEKRVIVLRFALESDTMMSISEIAKELKVSKEIVRRNERKAILKLQKFEDLKDLMG